MGDPEKTSPTEAHHEAHSLHRNLPGDADASEEAVRVFLGILIGPSPSAAALYRFHAPRPAPSGSTTPRWIRGCKLLPSFDERPFDKMSEERDIMGLSLPSEPLKVEHDQLDGNMPLKVVFFGWHHLNYPNRTDDLRTRFTAVSPVTPMPSRGCKVIVGEQPSTMRPALSVCREPQLLHLKRSASAERCEGFGETDKRASCHFDR